MDVAPPSEEEILRLVAERESHRQARRFADSDAIREQLRTMGVELYDKEKEWRCKDGRRGHLFKAGPTACLLSEDDIAYKISQREEARSAKDYERADSVRDELRQNGIELDDRTRSWRTGCGRAGNYNGVVSGSSSRLSEEQIRALVVDRERARAAHDFARADEVRRHLLSMGVELFDNERVWRALDGRHGTIVSGGADIVHCTLTDVDIQVHVAAREDARSRKDWATADRYRDELRRHGVELLDNAEKWKTTDGRAGPYSAQPQHSHPAFAAPPPIGAAHVSVASTAAVEASPPGSQSLNAFAGAVPGAHLTTASIESLIAGREAARDAKDYAAADGIRQDLRAHGIEVWDKQKTWKAIDGRSGSFSTAVAAALHGVAPAAGFHGMAMAGLPKPSVAPLPPPATPPPQPMSSDMAWLAGHYAH